MKKYIILPLLASLLITGCSTSKKIQTITAPITAENILTNGVDSMSYALGINMGTSFANDLKDIPGGKYNADLIIKGFSQALKGDSTLINNEDAQSYFRNYLTQAQQRDNEAKKAESEKFMTENKQKEGVVTTESGLQYQILQQTEGAKPNATDKVKVHYTGSTTDGHVFDSSIERDEPLEFGLGNVIKGWSEGVKLMSVGSKYKLFIPYDLGYGEQGIPQAGIPPFAPLIFEVELLEIIPQVTEN